MTPSAALLLALLLSLRPPADLRPCLTARAPEIARAAGEAQALTGVPAELVLAVGYLETHLGCARGSGGCWGAPVSRRRRAVAGTHLHSARALAWGRRRCGSWHGAVSHYRCGLCSCRSLRGYGAGEALALARRMEAGR